MATSFTGLRSNFPPPVLKFTDMNDEMVKEVYERTMDFLEMYTSHREVAQNLKNVFETKYNPTWHCIIGRLFGAHVTYEAKNYIYFYIGQVAVLLYKSP